MPMGVCLSLTACSEKDDYRKHIDEAKTKWAQCEKDAEAAMRSRDKSTLETLMADGSEYNLARNAIKEDKRLQREKEENERKAKLATDIAQVKAQLKQQI